MRELIKEHNKRVVFIVADFKHNQTHQLAQQYEVRYVPHYVMLNSRGESTVALGSQSKDQLRQLIEEGLK